MVKPTGHFVVAVKSLWDGVGSRSVLKTVLECHRSSEELNSSCSFVGLECIRSKVELTSTSCNVDLPSTSSRAELETSSSVVEKTAESMDSSTELVAASSLVEVRGMVVVSMEDDWSRRELDEGRGGSRRFTTPGCCSGK